MANFVTYQDEWNKLKIQNLYKVNMFLWFVWILFHFTIIYFFWIILQSTSLVWLFLWIWNFIALLADIPVWVLQKYIKPKNFLYLSSSFFIVACVIFLRFLILNQWIEIPVPQDWEIIDKAKILIDWFLSNWLNIILLVVLVWLYWIIKEANDVTMLSYVLNNTTPSETAEVLSKNNIFAWVWSMIWLILSGSLLALNSIVAVIIFFLITTWFIVFLQRYFDNGDDTLKVQDLSKLKNIKLDSLAWDLSKKRDNFVQNINSKTLIELAKKHQVLLLKPIDWCKKINFKEVITTTRDDFTSFFNILFKTPNKVVLWVLWLIMLYWFWDTFVATFLIDFLKEILKNDPTDNPIKMIGWYWLLWLIVIPAFVCQDMFIKLSKKIWVIKVVIIWIALSTASMLCFWFFKEFSFVLIFGLLNSVWYAATMPLAQTTFSELYTLEYAKYYKLQQVDSTVSAWPLKIVLNWANVIWLVIWWMIVAILSFSVFFVIFALILGWMLGYTIKKIKSISIDENVDFSEKTTTETENDLENNKNTINNTQVSSETTISNIEKNQELNTKKPELEKQKDDFDFN